jgi:hypothetical protein
MGAPFLDWINGASIYIGWDRYGQFGSHGFVIASNYDDSDKLRQAIENLNAGDIEAFEAGEWIRNSGCWLGVDPDPVIAMAILMGKMREYQRQLDHEIELKLRFRPEV